MMDGVAQATFEELRHAALYNFTYPEQDAKWFMTQMQIYGIPYRSSMILSELKQTLKNAVNMGQVSFKCTMRLGAQINQSMHHFPNLQLTEYNNRVRVTYWLRSMRLSKRG